MKFEYLSYKAKIKICELFYVDSYKVTNGSMFPSRIYFSWSKVIFETKSGEKSTQRFFVENWYSKNLKIIRKEKLLEIDKNLL